MCVCVCVCVYFCSMYSMEIKEIKEMELINKNIECFEYWGMLALFVFPPLPFSLFFLFSSLLYFPLLWYCSRILFMPKHHDFLYFPPSLQPQIISFNIISNSHKITHRTIFQFLMQPHNFFPAILHSFISKLKPTTSTCRQIPQFVLRQ